MLKVSAAKDNGRLNVRELSLSQPTHAIEKPLPSEAPDPRFLRFLAEYGALPVDLAARLVRCTENEVLTMIEQGVKLGWIRLREYPAEPQPWALLRSGGLAQFRGEFRKRKVPRSGLLTHRREVIEVHLLLREEKRGWRWTCEAPFRPFENEGLTIPDGVLKRGKKRWAIEVERSRKLTKKLRKKLETLCTEYDKVVYFGSPHVRTMLASLQKTDEFSNLEVRPLPNEGPEQQEPRYVKDDYKPSAKAFQMLAALNKEGIVTRAQLHRLMEWTPSETDRVLEELKQNICVKLGLEVNDDKGWVWCNHRGAARSNTGLPPVVVPSRGELVRRIVLMEIRLDALSRWPGSTWITRRLLDKGHAGRQAGTPRAVVERDGCRYAVMVLESCPQRGKTAALLERWKKDYAGVLCYRSKKLAPWVDGLLEEHDLKEWVKVRDIPKPPASLPYQHLEDEWQTGRERYEPTEQEMNLLRLVSFEGFVSEPQLPRALGITDDEEVEQLVDRLVKHKCLVRKRGWILCTARGSGISNTNLKAAPLPEQDRFLEQRFLQMELRLNHGEPASLETWKTRRQIGVEKRAEGARVPTNRHPDAAVLIDGEWHAVALLFRNFRRTKFVDVLTRWSAEYPKVKCYCRKEDLEDLQRFVKRHKLSSVEAAVFPLPPPGPARVRQEAIYTALKEEEKDREARYLPKTLAHEEVKEAIRTGRLVKPERCENCGEEVPQKELHGHHSDYSKPLDVHWICSKCHPAKDKARRQCESRATGSAKQDPRRSKRSPKSRAKGASQLSLT